MGVENLPLSPRWSRTRSPRFFAYHMTHHEPLAAPIAKTTISISPCETPSSAHHTPHITHGP